MDPRFVATNMLLIDHGWGIENERECEYTTSELDDIAAFGWPWEGLQRMVVTGLKALLPRRWQTIAGQSDTGEGAQGVQGVQGVQDEQGPAGDPLAGWVTFSHYEPR